MSPEPSTSPDRDELLRWVERVAVFCVDQYGLPPITGRILGWLMICDPPEQTAAEIADAIGASRASLTTNMRLVTAGDLVRRRTRPGGRTTYYRLDDDAWGRAIRRWAASMASFREITHDGMALVGRDDDLAVGRLRAAHRTSVWVGDVFSDRRLP